MKAVMLMFDSLNRNYLPAYGCEWTCLPNFQRLQEKCLTFDNFYAGSLPCMPARRELHTGRYNFLHRSWGPLEPFDDSAIERMKQAGIYTHLASDHTHYWEDGGGTYHTRYNTWQFSRGQEGDPWIGQVAEPEIPTGASRKNMGNLWRQDWVNRTFMQREENMPQLKTMENGLGFINRNHDQDRWFLQIELFDPHEPFFTPQRFKELYTHDYEGVHLDWPDYGPNDYSPEATLHVRKEYAALLSLCDESLGRLLDTFDQYGLWEDTMLLVNTDHGFMLGEKDWMGKNLQPCYNEVAHTPFFVWDPRCKKHGEHRTSLAQTVDIPPTLLKFFDLDVPAGIDGWDLYPAIESDKGERTAALFGVHGGHVNVTNGKEILMRAPVDVSNGPLFEYTLMPTHMNVRFSESEMEAAKLMTLEGVAKCPLIQVPAQPFVNAYWYGDLLFDLTADPEEFRPVNNNTLKIKLMNDMLRLMHQNNAPIEQYRRIGLPDTQEVDEEWLRTGGATKAYELPHPLADLPMTKRAQIALGVLVSMMPIDKLSTVVDGLQAAMSGISVELDEDKLMDFMNDFIPDQTGVMLISFIKGCLMYT